MFRRYTFLASYFILLSALTWWSGQIHPSPHPWGLVVSNGSIPTLNSGIDERLDLLETLDSLVACEHEYRSIHGRFTRMTQQLGCAVPSLVKNRYEIRVLEASRDRLRIIAFSEFEGRTFDLVSVDQDFQLHANFPLPLPRMEFLKKVANRHLRKIYEAPAQALSIEQGLFKDYFRYEIQEDLDKPRVVSATGIKLPVMGLHLEVSALTPFREEREEITEIDVVDQKSLELGRYPSSESKPIEIEEIISIEKKH